jgi:hypothetical protein
VARCSSIALALALANLSAGAAVQDGDSVALLQQLYAQARYGEALDEVGRLQDPVLAAEWRCYLALAAGDYPAALVAVRAGLAQQPEHRGLLVNAVHVALMLGLGDEALERANDLMRALDASAQPVAPDERARAERLLEAARAQNDLELESEHSVARAKILGGSILALSLAALLALARRPGRNALELPATPPSI